MILFQKILLIILHDDTPEDIPYDILDDDNDDNGNHDNDNNDDDNNINNVDDNEDNDNDDNYDITILIT